MIIENGCLVGKGVCLEEGGVMLFGEKFCGGAGVESWVSFGVFVGFVGGAFDNDK